MGYGLFPVLFAQNFQWDDLKDTDVEGSRNDESVKEREIKKVFFTFVAACFILMFLFGVELFF